MQAYAKQDVDIKIRTIARLDKLIEAGEKFYSVRSHPGKTKEVEEWREEINGMTATIWSNSSHYFGSLSRAFLFPRWYDPYIHGPMQDGETMRALTDSQASDEKTAFQIYKDGIRKILSILKSMRNDVDTVGMPEKQTQLASNTSPIIDFRPNLSNLSSPTYNNNPQFNQTQSQTVNNWIQELDTSIVEKLKDKSLEPHEKTFLEKIKGGLSSVKSLAETIGLAVESGAAVGLSAARVIQLLGQG